MTDISSDEENSDYSDEGNSNEENSNEETKIEYVLVFFWVIILSNYEWFYVIHKIAKCAIYLTYITYGQVSF